MTRTPKVGKVEDHVACTTQSGGCQIQDLFKLLGKSHTLDILHLFVTQEPGAPLRFVEVQNTLKLSPNTLSERLRDLVEKGLLTKTAFNEIPPRVDYEATEKARALRPVFRSLIDWTQQYDLQPVTTAPGAAEATG